MKPNIDKLPIKLFSNTTFAYFKLKSQIYKAVKLIYYYSLKPFWIFIKICTKKLKLKFY